MAVFTSRGRKDDACLEDRLAAEFDLESDSSYSRLLSFLLAASAYAAACCINSKCCSPLRLFKSIFGFNSISGFDDSTYL